MRGEGQPIIKAAVWVLLIAATLPTKADPDLWGNLRFGGDVLETGEVTTIDPYSFTQDKPWVNHSWLPQAVMAFLFERWGTAALVAFKAALTMFTLWLVARAFAGSGFLVPEAAAAWVLVAALPVVTTVRAQIVTIVGIAVLVRMMQSAKPWPMMFAPVVFVVWVNSHVGWMIGFLLLILWALERVVRGSSSERRRGVLVVLGCAAATLVNPFGWELWGFSASVAHLSRDITEWQPLWRGSSLNQAAFITTAITAGLLSWRHRRELSLSLGIFLLALAYASVSAVKFVHLFVEVAVLLLAPVIRARFPARLPATSQPLGVYVITGAMATALLVFAVASSWEQLTCLPSDAWRPDARAAHSLRQAQAKGRISVHFDWGEYVIWHLGPELRVSFDPRFDLVYSAETIEEQLAVRDAAPRGVAFLARERPEYVWFPQSSTRLKDWLTSQGYRIDVDTPESFVAVRGDGPTLVDAGPRAHGCFPD